MRKHYLFMKTSEGLTMANWAYILLVILAVGSSTWLVEGKLRWSDGRLQHHRKEDPVAKDVYDTLLHVAKHGLQETGHSKHVIIVGAGIAGLTAAKVLKDAGHKVTVLEASDHVGGRVQTYRHCINEKKSCFYVELGAMRIPSIHKLVETYVKKFGLTYNHFIESSENTYYYVNGKKHTSCEVDENPDILGYNTNATEKGQSASKLFKDAVIKALDGCPIDTNAECFREFDKYSVQGFLTEVAQMSPGAIDMIGIILNEEALFATAFSEAIRDQSDITDDTEFLEIVGGNDQLPMGFVSELEKDIELNSKVHTVKYDSNSVTVQYTVLGGPTHKSSEVTGDYVLLTATAKATSLMHFHPDLNLEKQKALRAVHYDSSTKIVLVFSRPFWEGQGIRGGRSINDLPTRFIYYPSHSLPSGLGVLLASYTWSDDSTKLTALSDEDCLIRALDDIALLHGDGVKDLYMTGVVKKWSNDPFSVGAFALFTPYQQNEFVNTLLSSQGRLYFAGEHTALPHAWIETAMRSTLIAALKINAEEYDVVVIGGGPMGLAAAYQSAKKGAKVVVLERSDFGNGEGSSAGKTRQFRQMYPDINNFVFAKESIRYWKELDRELKEQENSKCLNLEGYLLFGVNTANTTGDMDTIRDNCETLQQSCEFLNNKQLKSRFPQFSDLPDNYEGIYHAQSGFINVEKTMKTLLGLCKKSKVSLKSRETVVDIQRDNNLFNVYTQKTMIKAKKLIIAPGPYVNNVTKLLGFELNMTIWELPSMYFKLKDAGVSQTLPTWFMFGGETKKLFYGFRENSFDHPGYAEVSPDFVNKVIYDPSQRTNVPDAVTIQATVEFVKEHMPDLDASNYILETQTCLINFVPDGGFVLDHAPPQIPHYKDIVVYNTGWGFKFTPLFGKIMADLALDDYTMYNIKDMAITRPGVLKNQQPCT